MQAPAPLIILGTNGNCVDIAEAAEAGGQQVLGFLDDAEERVGTAVAGYPVLGCIAEASRFPEACFAMGIGSPKSYRHKKEIIARAGIPRERWYSVIHPTANVSRHATLGAGCVLLGHVNIGAHVRLGDHCLLLQGCVVSHDTQVGDYAVLATSVSISGGCRIGSNTYLGCGSRVREGAVIGDGALIGIGSVVLDEVGPGCVAYGIPARART